MRVAVAFDQPHLSRIAIESAFELFGQAVVSQFAGRQRTLPYEVSCASCTFDAVYRVSGDPRARELAELARAWFCRACSSPPGSSRRAGGYSPVLRLTADEMSLPLFPCPKKFTFRDTTLLPRGTFWVKIRAPGPLADAPRPVFLLLACCTQEDAELAARA